METQKVIEQIKAFVESELEQAPGYFLVEVHTSPSNQLKVYVDADHGAAIDQLAWINRAVYRRIEETALFGTDGNFSLEVSSPGLDEPLKSLRQYRKNIGRKVEISMEDGLHHEGKLMEVTDEVLVLEKVSGPKKEKTTEQIEIPFNQIKFTKVCVVF